MQPDRAQKGKKTEQEVLAELQGRRRPFLSDNGKTVTLFYPVQGTVFISDDNSYILGLHNGDEVVARKALAGRVRHYDNPVALVPLFNEAGVYGITQVGSHPATWVDQYRGKGFNVVVGGV
jgi:hypothetical protein